MNTKAKTKKLPVTCEYCRHFDPSGGKGTIRCELDPDRPIVRDYNRTDSFFHCAGTSYIPVRYIPYP